MILHVLDASFKLSIKRQIKSGRDTKCFFFISYFHFQATVLHSAKKIESLIFHEKTIAARFFV